MTSVSGTHVRSMGVASTEEVTEQARRAVRAFRALQPTLTAYARVLTKKKNVRVEMATHDNGSTDGTRIFFRPPIALGDPTSHNRHLCDKRDEDKILLCPACNNRETTLVTIYHEIAHIAFDTFAPVAEKDKAELIANAVAEVSGKYAEQIKSKIENAPIATQKSYLSMCALISEFLPTIFNALEDARVNREMFKARKGTKIMFEADDSRIFREGIEYKHPVTGEIVNSLWTEAPQNSQVMVGLYCKAAGYDYSNWFIPPVIKALDDDKLTDLLRRMDTIRNAAGIYHLSFPVLARLRELGFCRLPDDPEDEEKDSGEEEGEPESEPESQEGSYESDESGSSSAATSSGESGESSESSEQDSDEESDEESGEGSVDADTTTEGDDDASSDAPEQGDLGESDDSGDEHEDSGDLQPEGDSAGESSRGISDDQDSDESREAGADDSTDSSDAYSRPSVPESEDSRNTGDDSELDRESPSSPERGGEEAGSGSDSSSEGENSESDDLSGDDRPGEIPEADVDEPASEPESGEVSPIDTGADDGTGGIEVIEDEKYDHIPMGEPKEVELTLTKWLDHEDKPKTIAETEAENAVDKAVIQGLYFETPSRNVYGVREHRWNKPNMIGSLNMSEAWNHSSYRDTGYSLKILGIIGEFDAPESILGPALLRMRVAFSDNKRGHEQRHRKSGKVDGRVLGKRAFTQDERLFKKRIVPGKKDYFVLIGMDVSGSTMGRNLILEKRAVMAQAELCARMGIKFAIYAYTGNYHDPMSGRGEGFDLDVYIIKESDEVWDDKTKERLRNIGPSAANLDGHSLEYFRKILDRRLETDKVILYYSDGKMPAENYDEELEILQREIKICKQKGYTLLGVGIRTDSPARHGLPTVQVTDDSDIVKVIQHLEKRLLA